MIKYGYLQTMEGLKPITILEENIIQYGINYTKIIDYNGNEILIRPINLCLITDKWR